MSLKEKRDQKHFDAFVILGMLPRKQQLAAVLAASLRSGRVAAIRSLPPVKLLAAEQRVGFCRTFCMQNEN